MKTKKQSCGFQTRRYYIHWLDLCHWGWVFVFWSLSDKSFNLWNNIHLIYGFLGTYFSGSLKFRIYLISDNCGAFEVWISGIIFTERYGFCQQKYAGFRLKKRKPIQCFDQIILAMAQQVVKLSPSWLCTWDHQTPNNT